MNLYPVSFFSSHSARWYPRIPAPIAFLGNEDTFQIKHRNSLKTVLENPEAKARLKAFIARGPLKQVDPNNADLKIEQLFSHMKRLTSPNSRLTEQEIIANIHDYLRTTLYPGISFEQSADLDVKRANNTRQEIVNLLSSMGLQDWKPGAYMDLGCGDGLLAANMGRFYGLASKRVIAADITQPPCSSEYTALQLNGEDLSRTVKENSQDLITLLAVLHHTQNPKEMLSECYKALKPGGYLIIRDHDYPKSSRVDRELQHVVETFYNLIYPEQPQPHMDCPENYNSKEAWVKIFQELGYQVRFINPVPNHPLKPFYAVLQKSLNQGLYSSSSSSSSVVSN